MRAISRLEIGRASSFTSSCAGVVEICPCSRGEVCTHSKQIEAISGTVRPSHQENARMRCRLTRGFPV